MIRPAVLDIQVTSPRVGIESAVKFRVEVRTDHGAVVIS